MTSQHPEIIATHLTLRYHAGHCRPRVRCGHTPWPGQTWSGPNGTAPPKVRPWPGPGHRPRTKVAAIIFF